MMIYLVRWIVFICIELIFIYIVTVDALTQSAVTKSHPYKIEKTKNFTPSEHRQQH
jgi:hypothetical protein